MVNKHNSYKIEQAWPILSIKDDVVVSKNGDLTLVYKITLPETFSMSSENYDDLHLSFIAALKSLPREVLVHKQDWYVNTEYTSEISDNSGFLRKSYFEHFSNRKYLQHKTYLYFTLTSQKKISSPSSHNILTNLSVVFNKYSQETIYSFITSVERCVNILSTKLRCSKLLESEIVKLLKQYMNLSTDKDDIFSDMSLSAESICIGDKEVISYTLSSIEQLEQTIRNTRKVDEYSTTSTDVNLSTAYAIGYGLQCNHIVNQYIYLQDNKQFNAELQRKNRIFLSLGKVSKSNEVAHEQISQYLEEDAIESVGMIKLHTNILAWGESRSSLHNKISVAFNNMGIKPIFNVYNTPCLFWAGIIGNGSGIGGDDFITVPLSAAIYMTISESNQVSTGGELNITDRLTGVPLQIDLSNVALEQGEIENFNKFILGGSGSGKSFFTNHLLRNYYDNGNHVLIIDIGDSYLPLCKIIQEESNGKDGVYYDYEPSSPISFNPFYVYDKIYDQEKKDFISQLIAVLWKGGGELSQAERVTIDDSVDEFIQLNSSQNSNITTKEPAFNEYYEYILNTFSHDEKRRVQFDFDNFLYVLKRFYKGGGYEYLLNSTEPLNLTDNRFIVFEIDKIQKNEVLFPIVTLMLMDIFVTKMRRIPQKKVMLIEEAWKAIAYGEMAKFIQWLWKTARKHNAEAVVVTQEIEDIISSEVVKNAIINNSAIRVLLDQAKFKNNFTLIETLLGVSPLEKAQILSINTNIHPLRKYKEAWLKIGNTKSQVYAVEVSRQEYWAYTTTKPERLKLLSQVEKSGGYINAIKELTK